MKVHPELTPTAPRLDRSIPTKTQFVAGIFRMRAVQVFLATFVLLYLRRPDVLDYAQFWSEDGKVFFLQQLSWGLKTTIHTTYLEYLLTLQRLIAAFAALWPTSFAPYIYNLAALSIEAGSCSLFALPHFRYLVRSDALRFLVCCAFAAVIEANEILGTITNIQWYLALSMTLMLVAQYPAQSRKWTIVRTGTLGTAGLLIGLTSPQCIILLPLALWRIYRNYGIGKLWPVFTALGILVEALVAFYLHRFGGYTGAHLTLDQFLAPLFTAFIYRPVFSTSLGAPIAQWISSHHEGLVLLSLTLITCWLTMLWKTTHRTGRWCIAVCLYLIGSSIVLAFVGRGEYFYFQGLKNSPWSSERFYLLAAAAYLFLIAFSLEAWSFLKSTKTALGIFILLVSGGLIGNFHPPAHPNFHWFREAKQIDRWVAQSHRGTASGVLVLYPPGYFQWGLILPCRLPDLTKISGLEGCLVTPAGNSNAPKPIYFIQDGKKRHLSSPNWFLYQSELHFPEDLRQLPSPQLDAIPAGQPLE